MSQRQIPHLSARVGAARRVQKTTAVSKMTAMTALSLIRRAVPILLFGQANRRKPRCGATAPAKSVGLALSSRYAHGWMLKSNSSRTLPTWLAL